MYDLQQEKPGFPTLLISGIELREGEIRNLSLIMELPDSPLVRPRLRPRSERLPLNTPPDRDELSESEPAYPRVRRPLRTAEQTGPASQAPFPAQEPVFRPSGYAGRDNGAVGTYPMHDFISIADRWRLGLPEWDRYSPYVQHGDFPYTRGRPLDPYNQNVWKGDYPILGDRWFMALTATSDTLLEYRQLPVVGPPSASQPGTPEFFSKGDQFQLIENLIFSADLFRGYTAFQPFDIRFKVTPVFNGNYLRARETGVVDIDVRRGSGRTDSHLALQEAFAEIRLAETSPYFDFLSLRAGTQFFNSDFRGFIFFDNQPGIRLFGNLKANKHEYNLAYFYMVEKDTNSLLNTFDSRRQEVFVANYYIQDFIRLGYTAQFSLHFNRDKPSFHIDHNGFLVRPALVGNVVPKSVNAIYLGWTGDGHFGRLNINHAFYQVLGQEKPNQIAGDVFGPKDTDINAQMVALELSVDRDWRRYRASFFYASGDSNPHDDRARGFDSIVDNVNFAGGGISFWNRQGFRLTGTGVGLTQRFSFNPSLRSAKEKGQANHVNPGMYIFNAGVDTELTPKLRASANLNVMAFAHTEVLESLLFQSDIGRFVGVDLGLGVRYRPWLNNNLVMLAGAATLVPGGGFRDIYTSQSLFSSFLEVRLTY